MGWRRTYRAQVVQILAPWGWSDHLIIERHDERPITCMWDVIQQIKDDMLGGDVLAIEMFPSAHKVVNEVNRRHLWSVPPDVLPIGL